jgi:HEAT repeat protein
MTDINEVSTAIKALQSGGISQRRGAAKLLGQMLEPKAIKPLIQALEDNDTEVI